MRLKRKLVSVRLEVVLILTQDRCMVCAKRTVGLEIILDAPDGTPRCRGSCGVSFWSVESQCRCKIGAMELQGDVGNVESLFGSFGDSVGVGAR